MSFLAGAILTGPGDPRELAAIWLRHGGLSPQVRQLPRPVSGLQSATPSRDVENMCGQQDRREEDREFVCGCRI